MFTQQLPSLHFAAAILWHYCEVRIKRHLRHKHHDTVKLSGRNQIQYVESCLASRVCLGMPGFESSKSHDIMIDQDAGGVLNTSGIENRGDGVKIRYSYWCWCNFLVELVRCNNGDSNHAFCWLLNTQQPCLDLPQPPGTSWMRIVKMGFNNYGENSVWHQVLR